MHSYFYNCNVNFKIIHSNLSFYYSDNNFSYSIDRILLLLLLLMFFVYFNKYG